MRRRYWEDRRVRTRRTVSAILQIEYGIEKSIIYFIYLKTGLVDFSFLVVIYTKGYHCRQHMPPALSNSV